MQARIIVLIAVAIVAVAGISVFYTVGISGKFAAAARGPSAPYQQQGVAGLTLSGANLTQYAYLISEDPLSADSKKATTGFDLRRAQLSNGSVEIDLMALKQGYVTQKITYSPGESVYFIERSWGDDDADSDEDGTLRDDFAVVTDSDGVIVQ